MLIGRAAEKEEAERGHGGGETRAALPARAHSGLVGSHGDLRRDVAMCPRIFRRRGTRRDRSVREPATRTKDAMTKLRCRVAFSAVLVLAPLSAVAVGVAPEPAASAGSPSYTVFELPVIGSSAFIGQTSGLVFTNYKEFQIDDSSDSVTQLPVPSAPSYWTDNGTFATTHGAFVAMSMNSSGEFSGTITSGPDAGYGGIWDNGSVTAVAPIASVTGSGYVEATPATFVYSESLTNGKPSVDLSVINDEGLAGGTESFNCTFYDAGFPGGAGCQPRTIAVLWNGGSLQVASGQLSATENVGYDCGPTGVFPSQLNTLNNSGGMAGVACGLLPTGSSPPAGVAYFTWQAGGAPELGGVPLTV